MARDTVACGRPLLLPDDDGYVIQWLRSAIPSNTLAVLNGLALDCQDRRILGDDVEIVVTALDETNTRIRPRSIASLSRASPHSSPSSASSRKDRRPTLPIESPFIFYPRYFANLLWKHIVLAGLMVRYGWLRATLQRDPEARNYTDEALTPVPDPADHSAAPAADAEQHDEAAALVTISGPRS